ncbi:hypothetical protein COS31_03345 [Candidatus Roizmanbacteria bacterium CG02_land_8_20_14_3_00_36_15]|uniref:Uncharacterized protein n=2 Tax=Candidatus Roizmaniibacteriota TaxID=1752723 RepID=A0A2M8KLG4_9BACT|nr:MAG: hypothetical protein COS51_03445 [Candidatus Roizmanbacteria bacterium CG03_land_8_20_14_0_80_36_21]PIV37712.1 MAG: hypothetical protein COS31_03345 [Candidatus Roizmanbacteria bacterium CG02_land_8_20_14_3_00_36_15]PIY69669.1 MAG: hypothetical protein COY89_05350 [Candidatus Roizmanbacteria bacterium CG_4_10_14_0_8_um_filter_36_36]PJA53542.1 MAG: hypothetical protein CO166_01560 [Candidatus Roizmanbacteria bacterium CG_4_9_14_3_um_filter_36_11]PJC81820.1 MAG: hypothetical protein CO007
MRIFHRPLAPRRSRSLPNFFCIGSYEKDAYEHFLIKKCLIFDIYTKKTQVCYLFFQYPPI